MSNKEESIRTLAAFKVNGEKPDDPPILADSPEFKIRNVLKYPDRYRTEVSRLTQDVNNPYLSKQQYPMREKFLKKTAPPINLFNPSSFTSNLSEHDINSDPVKFNMPLNAAFKVSRKIIILVSSEVSGLGKTYISSLINNIFQDIEVDGKIRKFESKVVSFSTPLKKEFEVVAYSDRYKNGSPLELELRDFAKEEAKTRIKTLKKKGEQDYLWDRLSRENKEKFRPIMKRIGNDFDAECEKFHENFNRDGINASIENGVTDTYLDSYIDRDYHAVAKHIYETIVQFDNGYEHRHNATPSLELLIFDDLRAIREIHAVNVLAKKFGIDIMHFHLVETDSLCDDNKQKIIDFCDVILQVEKYNDKPPVIVAAHIHDKISRVSNTSIATRTNASYKLTRYADGNGSTTEMHFGCHYTAYKHQTSKVVVDRVTFNQRVWSDKTRNEPEMNSLWALKPYGFEADRDQIHSNPTNSFERYSICDKKSETLIEYYKFHGVKTFYNYSAPIGYDDLSLLFIPSMAKADNCNRFKLGAILTCLISSGYDGGYIKFSLGGNKIETDLSLWECMELAPAYS